MKSTYCAKHEDPRDQGGRCAHCVIDRSAGWVGRNYQAIPIAWDILGRPLAFLRKEGPPASFQCPLCKGTGWRANTRCDGCGGTGKIG